jgi:putative membrane protein
MQTPPAPTAWNLDPIMLVALALLLGGYFVAIGPLRPKDEPSVAPRRIACYVGGWLVLALTMLTPLDTLGRYYLFSAHTAQVFLDITLTAPLLMLGLPEWLVARLLPLRALRDATRGLLFTVACALGFNALVLIWHAGPLYEAANHSAPLHDLQALCFLVAGVLTWWPLLTPLDRHTRMSNPVQMLYLALESLPLDIFGAFAIFAGYAFYPTYVHAPRVFPGINAMGDQQFAGVLLAVPGNIIDIGLISVVFFLWIGGMERAQRARERAMYEAEDEAAAQRDVSLPTPPASQPLTVEPAQPVIETPQG